MHKKQNKLMNPGGHVELNENPWQAILHELEEETGYAAHQLKIYQPPWAISSLSGAISHPIPFCVNTHEIGDTDHFHTDMTYIFSTDSYPENQVGEGESSDLRWLTYDEVEQLDDSSTVLTVRDYTLRAFKECLTWDSVLLDNYSA